MKKYKNYKLCYICDGLAYFTNKELNEQWGDDWDDVPYEHNAGEPYYEKEGDIIKINFTSEEYLEPKEYHLNSPYSVEEINNKSYPWLRPSYNYELKSIYAGITLDNFTKLITEANGEIDRSYLK